MSARIPMAVTDPELIVALWDPDGVAPGDPHVHTRRSHRDFAWRHVTESGEVHRWLATPAYVATRWAEGRIACGVCHPRRRSTVAGSGRSLSDLRPDLAAEWHPSNAVAADEVTPGSRRTVEWRCAGCGYAWSTRVEARTKLDSTGCPRCAGQRAEPGDPRTLALVEPGRYAELVTRKLPAEVDPLTILASSNRPVTWRCPTHRLHWVASPHDRNAGVGCPRCATGGSSRIERDLLAVIQTRHAAGGSVKLEVAWNSGAPKRPLRRSATVDILVPDLDLIVEYDGLRRHSRPEGKRCDLAKTTALFAAGFRVVRVRESSRAAHLPLLDLSHPHLAQITHRYGDDVEALAERVLEAAERLPGVSLNKMLTNRSTKC